MGRGTGCSSGTGIQTPSYLKYQHQGRGKQRIYCPKCASENITVGEESNQCMDCNEIFKGQLQTLD